MSVSIDGNDLGQSSASPKARAAVRRVGLVSPGWPAGSLSNGIVTYVSNMRAGLGAVGIGSAVIANAVDGGIAAGEERDVVDASAYPAPLHLRAMWKTQERVAGMTTLERRLGAAVAAGLRVAHGRMPLDLVEMEESLGAAHFARNAVPRPMVVRLHGPWCLVSPALGRPDQEVLFVKRVSCEGRAIAGADAVSSPSRHALESVRAHYNLPLEHAAVVPNPIAVQPEGQRWRYEDCDKRTVLFVGRFDRLKGGDVVLAAFARLCREDPDGGKRLVFVGPDRGFRDAAGKDWGFDEYLRAHIPPDVAARIEMLGEQSPAAIAKLRRTSYVTIMASRFETFSMTAVEALSHGCPLVAPAAGAIVEIVEHGRNGLLFGSADPEDAARQLLCLFRQPDLASRLGAEGAADATRRFAPEVVARQMSAFYDDVHSRWTQGRPGRHGPSAGRRTGPVAPAAM